MCAIVLFCQNNFYINGQYFINFSSSKKSKWRQPYAVIDHFKLLRKLKWLPPREDTPDWWDWLHTAKVINLRENNFSHL